MLKIQFASNPDLFEVLDTRFSEYHNAYLGTFDRYEDAEAYVASHVEPMHSKFFFSSYLSLACALCCEHTCKRALVDGDTLPLCGEDCYRELCKAWGISTLFDSFTSSTETLDDGTPVTWNAEEGWYEELPTTKTMPAIETIIPDGGSAFIAFFTDENPTPKLFQALLASQTETFMLLREEPSIRVQHTLDVLASHSETTRCAGCAERGTYAVEVIHGETVSVCSRACANVLWDVWAPEPGFSWLANFDAATAAIVNPAPRYLASYSWLDNPPVARQSVFEFVGNVLPLSLGALMLFASVCLLAYSGLLNAH
jgi:hypothetical protein